MHCSITETLRGVSSVHCSVASWSALLTGSDPRPEVSHSLSCPLDKAMYLKGDSFIPQGDRVPYESRMEKEEF